ncbi:collagen alpha-2(VIII) chain-like isoform X2 [Mytilus californianus]|uniref:collagen alpha-2(VIII) chain-like isoform X2 n=1 Tax=Mytilus californianus TaxID=6549 RepID=UPI002246BF34|nr:collagen alpha-2(VIII) chain-like isoform X2 [Mytilus californianus]
MDQAKLHPFFIIMLMSCVQSMIWSQEPDKNSSIEVSLLDNQQMPLVALFDTTKLNQVLKDYIIKTVEEATNQRIPIIKTAVIKGIGYEPGRIHERPAFTASMRTDSTLHSNEVIKFDQVWLNIGSGYNPTTGVFTVPRNGLYFVSSTVMSLHAQNLHCRLWKNNQITLGLFGFNYSSGTLHSAMPLKKGDIIYIKHDARAGETILGRHYSMFSAYLINEQ